MGYRFKIIALYYDASKTKWAGIQEAISLSTSGIFLYICEFVGEGRVYLVPIWISQKEVEGKAVQISYNYRSRNLCRIYYSQSLKRSQESGSEVCMFKMNYFRIQEV